MKKHFILAVSFLLISCVSFHGTHRYSIVAYETNSHRSANGYPVRIIYPYDNYGIFYYLNAPEPLSTCLDSNGKAEVEIENFWHPNIVVGSTIFELDENILKNGGTPHKFTYRNDDARYKKQREIYTVYQLPQKRYPEVDLTITMK